MKYFYILLLCISSIGFAQIPANYYDSAEGLTGYALKTELMNIITNGHNDQGYNALYYGYETTHSDNMNVPGYENDNTVLSYYNENPNGPDPYSYNHHTNKCGNYNSENDCYNREHLVPQSSFNSASPMKNDIHHVVPSDGYVNGQRGSFPFGTVGNATWTSLNGSKKGSSNVPGYSGTVFEPIDEFKGDIARAILYFVTRYQNNVDNYTSFQMFNGTNDQALESWAVDMLLDWHYNVDPVDAREIARNHAAYNFQGNANPFVDHPEYANMIWNPTPDTEAPSNPTNLIASNPTDNSITLSWTPSNDNVSVASYDVFRDGVFAFSTSENSTTAYGLSAETEYCFTVRAKDTSGNTSGFSNEACETTTNNGSVGGGTECISESFENIPDNASGYSIRTWTGDDGGTWTATDARTDQTLSNRAITIREGALTMPTTTGGIGSLTVTTLRVFSGGSGTFNVNVNGVLVGTIPFSGSEQTTTISNINIENNVSVVIDGNSNGDRVIFDDLSYTCYAPMNVEEFNIETVKLHPNPTKGSLTIGLKSSKDTNIEIYDILGKPVFRTLISKTSTIDLQNLKSGIYIVKITQNNSTITKKLVKQ